MSSAAPPPRLARWRGLFLPLRARLVGLFFVLALAVTVTFLLGIHAVQHEGWRGYMHPLVTNYADMLVAEIGTPPDLDRARAIAARLPLHIRIDGPQVNWDSADEPRPVQPLPPPPPPPPNPGATPGLEAGPPATPGPGVQIPLILPTPHPPPPSAARPPHRLLPRAPELDPMALHVVRRLTDGHRIWIGLAEMPPAERAQHVGWATLAVILLLTVLAYAGVRHMLAPLQALREGTVRFGQGDFSRPIEPRDRDELGDLAVEINAMAARLHRMLDAKRQLLLAISHELRSPLARARLNAELIDESAERSALLRDLGEMRDLINDLLESERLADMRAGGHSELHAEPTDLAALVREQFERTSGEGAGLGAPGGAPPGLDASVRLDLEAGLPPLALDRMRMKLLLRNLVDNALRHGADAARPPELRLRRSEDGRQAILQVRDFGPGMDPAQLEHAADAFYRADAARQRSTGGVGLGLYLCRLVTEAHGGELVLRNADPGFLAEVRLPMAAAAPTAGLRSAS